MSGHSKYANIKHRKGAQDAKRGKIFTRIIKEITIAVKEGGGPDIDMNPALRRAIANAKGVNLPKETCDRAIKKASGADATTYHELTFEGYGPNGVAFFIECTTDNTNRSVANVRSIFNKNGGELGKNGSLEFIFDRKGVFVLERANISIEMEDLEMELIDGGASDIEFEEDLITVYTNFSDFGLMSSTLEKLKIEPKSAELERIPNNTKELPVNKAKIILSLAEKFEEDDDVQNVFHNLEITDELIAAMEAE
jgi:YebC/PmpR family DNA-binding regulatory protein